MRSTTYNEEGDITLSYGSSNIRGVINDFCNGFTDDVNNAIKVQRVYSGATDTYYDDKIKCPSMTELGCYAQCPGEALIKNIPSEGTIYPLFGDKQMCPNSLAIAYRSAQYSGEAILYFTRTIYYGTGYYAVAITSDGLWESRSISNAYLGAGMYIGIIRF